MKVKFISKEPWQTFEYGKIYDAYLRPDNGTWFVYDDNSKCFMHEGRYGFPVCEHKYCFEIITIK
jgi:hypothetical protein